MKKAKKPEGPEYPKVVETFRTFGSYELDQWRQPEISCFNGSIKVRRYRVTIEEIEEPPEVIEARLIELWETCTNHHHRAAIDAVAKRNGVTLDPKAWNTRQGVRKC